MKVTVLSENESRSGLLAEHGLSLYVETQKHKILFDFGASDNFAKNAEKLGIDLGTVDVAFLSHGHYDHSGGLLTFLDINKIALVYMHDLAFEPHYNGQNKYIGIDTTLAGHPRIIRLQDSIRIDDELSFSVLPSVKKPIETHGQKVKRGRFMEKEKYEHEMYLQIHEEYKDYLISGCTHKGILNLIASFRFDAFVGGLHMMKYDSVWDEEVLLEASSGIRNTCADFYTCHCTGREAYLFLKDEIGAKIHSISTGDSIILE